MVPISLPQGLELQPATPGPPAWAQSLLLWLGLWLPMPVHLVAVEAASASSISHSQWIKSAKRKGPFVESILLYITALPKYPILFFLISLFHICWQVYIFYTLSLYISNSSLSICYCSTSACFNCKKANANLGAGAEALFIICFLPPLPYHRLLTITCPSHLSLSTVNLCPYIPVCLLGS